MAKQTTRLAGLRARDSLRETSMDGQYANQQEQVARSPLQRGYQQRVDVRDQQTRPRLQFTQQANYEARKDSEIRQWAQLALSEKSANFNRDMQQKRFDLSQSTADFSRDMQTKNFNLSKQQADQSMESGKVNMALQKERLKQLRNPQETAPELPELDDVKGFYLSSAMNNLGVAESELYDGAGALTERGTAFIDSMNLLRSRNPKATDQDLMMQAAQHTGLRTEGQKQRFDLAAGLKEAQASGDKKQAKAIQQQLAELGEGDGTQTAYDAWWKKQHPEPGASDQVKDLDKKAATLGQVVQSGTGQQQGRGASVLLGMIRDKILSPNQIAQCYDEIVGEDVQPAAASDVMKELGLKQAQVRPGRKMRRLGGGSRLPTRSSTVAAIVRKMKVSEPEARKIYDAAALSLAKQRSLDEALEDLVGTSKRDTERADHLARIRQNYLGAGSNEQ